MNFMCSTAKRSPKVSTLEFKNGSAQEIAICAKASQVKKVLTDPFNFKIVSQLLPLQIHFVSELN